MRYTGFLIDADNTIFDFDRSEREALAQALGVRDGELLSEYRRINAELWRRAEDGGITIDEVQHERFRQLALARGLELDPRRISEAFLGALARSVLLMPGAVRVLDQLSRRAVLGLLTNGLQTVQRSRIARSVVGVFFQEIFIAGEIGASKPDPAIFLHAAGRLHLRPHEILVVGDSPSADIRGAHAAGMSSCWYNPAGRSYPPTEPLPDHVITSLEEILDFAPEIS